MSIYFSCLLEMLLVTTPCAVVLSVCIGVSGCGFPIYSRAWYYGMASLQLMKTAPSSPYAADDMTVLMILDIVNTDNCSEGTPCCLT